MDGWAKVLDFSFEGNGGVLNAGWRGLIRGRGG